MDKNDSIDIALDLDALIPSLGSPFTDTLATYARFTTRGYEPGHKRKVTTAYSYIKKTDAHINFNLQYLGSQYHCTGHDDMKTVDR